MIDVRPVGYVTGLLVACLGVTMLVPLAVDAAQGGEHWQIFLECATISILAGLFVAIACANGASKQLTRQQTFLMTAGVWVFLPAFGALPFVFGATDARVVDAVFEAMSGMTTTGATVFVGLEALPRGLLLWRSMLNWFGGVGVIIVMMVFLPELRVGGMQIFRTESFDTMGKVLPRAAQIASSIGWIYLGLTVGCYLSYRLCGMTGFDAINHAFATVSTGGFSTYDASFGAFRGAGEYVSSLFMVLASLPFVRYVQLAAGSARPLFRDSQVRAFLLTLAATVAMLVAFLILAGSFRGEDSIRGALFNATSVITGTGFASVDYQSWGAFPMVVFFAIGLVGGCAGSTSCAIKIFRFQILFSAIRAQVRQIHSPHGVFVPRYEGRPVAEDVLGSVMAFFVIFIVTLGVVSVLLTLVGLDIVTSISGAATALGNVGPGLGDRIGPAGNFAGLHDAAKWILTAAMLLGRLELMVVYVLLTRAFWRD